jgi:hypothetical protein
MTDRGKPSRSMKILNISTRCKMICLAILHRLPSAGSSPPANLGDGVSNLLITIGVSEGNIVVLSRLSITRLTCKVNSKLSFGIIFLQYHSIVMTDACNASTQISLQREGVLASWRPITQQGSWTGARAIPVIPRTSASIYYLETQIFEKKKSSDFREIICIIIISGRTRN